VETRRVVIARAQGNETVVASGLQAGEQVVTDGQTRLTGGAKVEVRAPAGRPGGGERPREAGGGTPAKPEGAKDPAAAKAAPAKDAKDTPRR
jgi:multidrug efflux system membrane fusion protein